MITAKEAADITAKSLTEREFAIKQYRDKIKEGASRVIAEAAKGCAGNISLAILINRVERIEHGMPPFSVDARNANYRYLSREICDIVKEAGFKISPDNGGENPVETIVSWCV